MTVCHKLKELQVVQYTHIDHDSTRSTIKLFTTYGSYSIPSLVCEPIDGAQGVEYQPLSYQLVPPLHQFPSD